MEHNSCFALGPADFESQVVGQPIYTILRWKDLKKLSAELRFCPHHIITKVDVQDRRRTSFLMEHGFCCNSTIVHLKLKLSGIKIGPEPKIRPLSLSHKEQLFRITDEAFCRNHNRYTDDVFLKRFCKKIYRAWIFNSLNGFADYRCGYFQGKKILGFGTLHFHSDASVIGLVASARKYRGQGIGSSIVRALIKAAQRHGSRTIVVKTQGTNIPAVKLYTKSGFCAFGAEATFYRTKQKIKK